MARPLNLCLITFAGAGAGTVISMLVNNALIEISLSSIFAVLFGCLLIFMGALIMWRVLSDAQGTSSSKTLVVAFSLLVTMAGVFCFFLEKDWFVGLRPTAKIPMYTLLGIALWFAVTFTIIDITNYSVRYCSPEHGFAILLSSASQICLVLIAVIILGAYFGILFGTLDVEDDTARKDSFAKLRSYTLYSVPVGAIAGGIVALLSATQLRKPTLNASHGFSPVFNDGI